MTKYQRLVHSLPSEAKGIVLAFEVCSENGQVSSIIDPLLELFRLSKKVRDKLKSRLQVVAIRASSRIFAARDIKEWGL